MAPHIACPRCGAVHPLRNPGIAMLVCDHCRATVYWGEDRGSRVVGESVLPPSDSRLFMHATGVAMGLSFQVIGHLRYRHDQGAWDEWFLSMGDGRTMWISEHQRQLQLQAPSSCPNELPAPADLYPGDTVTIGGRALVVREFGRAVLDGGEGQLPYRVVPGQLYPYAEFISNAGDRSLTLEYDDDGEAHAFAGQPLAHHELSIEDHPSPGTVGVTAGKNIRCSNCAAALEMPYQPGALTLVCDYCGAQLDLAKAELSVLGMNPEGPRPGFQFDIGASAIFGGANYEVCGRMVYTEMESAALTTEYLLYNPHRGYLWLSEWEGHYLLSRPSQAAPEPVGPCFYAAVGKSVRYRGQRYRKYDDGYIELLYVDGALPWKAAVGERFECAELVRPPSHVAVDRYQGGIAVFEGTYKTTAEVWEAFGRSDPPPPNAGVHPAQPLRRSLAWRVLAWAGALFAAVLISLLMWTHEQGSAWFLFGAIFCALFPLFAVLRRVRFELRRWAPWRKRA